jgi:hypothetical protein
MESGCVKRGLERSAPEPEVRAFCSCMTGVMREQLPKVEWQQLVVSAVKEDKGAAEAIFLRHKDALLACKKQ